MSPERWEKLNELFHSALERDGDARAAFLAQACDGDDELLHELETMLAHHQQAESFMESPAYAVEAKSIVADDVSATLIGRTVGSYQVLSELGRGGMGEVYLGFDKELQRKVALKFLHAVLTADKQRLRRFKREARAASALNHPNILTVFEVGEIDNLQFIATEFVEGRTLREIMNLGQMNLEQVIAIAVQICSALSAADAVGIIHRDIKPENIMLRPDGYIKIVDFGLAKLAEEQGSGECELTLIKSETSAASSYMSPDLCLAKVARSTEQALASEIATQVMTSPRMVMGTVQYMSPEQASGRKIDQRTDIFSLGVVLYEMTAGRLPFRGTTAAEIIERIIHAEPEAIVRFNRNAPAKFERIVSKSLEKDRKRRYQSTRELLVDLKHLERERNTRPGKASKARKVFHSLAILPFVNTSADPATEYLADGITESIINSLSQMPKLRILARSTVFRYRGREISSQEVGRELNVGAVLAGRVLHVADRLIIGVELVDVFFFFQAEDGIRDRHLAGQRIA